MSMHGRSRRAIVVTTQQGLRRCRSYVYLFALFACGVCMITLALASPITSGVDSYQTLDASLFFGNNSIPPDFFDPSSDAFMDTIPLTGAPLGAGATTDTVIQRMAAAKFKGPSPKSATVP